jgi:hypothetical protein
MSHWCPAPPQTLASPAFISHVLGLQASSHLLLIQTLLQQTTMHFAHLPVYPQHKFLEVQLLGQRAYAFVILTDTDKSGIL